MADNGEDAALVEPFHTFDHTGNEYVIEHGNVALDRPTPVTLWPLHLWRPMRSCGLRHTGPCVVPKHTHDYRMPRADGSRGCSYPGCSLTDAVSGRNVRP
jgi:hypothetical protein